MTEPHDWPFEQPAREALLPWYFTAAGYLAVLFRDPEEARRAQRDLLEHGVPAEDLRLYQAEETLRIAARLQQERSILAKAIAALVADRPARDRYLGNARAGGCALWIFAPTKDRADRLVRLLADYHYVSLRYYGDDDVKDVHGDID
ncbi:MAG TPA: hypothetical protein VFA46_15010 [Actinomycetes bacterium]|nr:hypothetical protein [Actinomycetes bacterium]